MNTFLQKISILTLVIVSSFIIVSKNTEAAFFFFEATDKSIGIKGEVEVTLFIDTEGEKINAIEGVISFPLDIVKIISVNDGVSIVDIWLQKPEETQEWIVFSGIIPGGFDVVRDPIESSEKPGKVLTFTLQSKKEGRILIVLKDIVALLNDGNGTSANISSTPFLINVFNYEGIPLKKKKLDIDLPEYFSPEITQDKNIFNGEYFLIFHTQDKSSGIDYYEISEFGEEWVTVESPYVLKDQLLQSGIKIRAVDKSGNKRMVELSATYPQASKRKSYFWGIIILIGAVILFRTRKNILNKIK